MCASVSALISLVFLITLTHLEAFLAFVFVMYALTYQFNDSLEFIFERTRFLPVKETVAINQ